MSGQKLMGEAPGRIAPARELVNAFEFEAMAERKLDVVAFAAIAGSDRAAFDRITFRPRLMIDATKLDLTTILLGQTMFAPIVVGPASQQKRFHPEGELAMARGASAAKAAMVVADKSSYPIDRIAAEAKATLWYQVDPEQDIKEVRGRIDRAVNAGCKAVCLTIGNWSAMERLRQGINVPVLLKGVMSPDEARRAIGIGVQGLIVSSYPAPAVTGIASPIEMLPSVVDAVGGKAPILIDGSFRRGSDVLKGLAMGAQAVLLGRPPLWGLAAYGADGVQKVIELIQTELARDMAMCGKTSIASIDRSIVKIHRR